MNSRQNLHLLKFNQSIDELITARIEGLNKAIVESGDDEHISQLIQMIISYISTNYSGVYIDNTLSKLAEANFWWAECIQPDITLSVNEEAE